jgi:lysophospholipase L1-like esterase
MPRTLRNSRIKFTSSNAGTVAFLGGSITEMEGYRPLVCNQLRNRFPKPRFKFINAGISSTTSTTGAFRLEQDVLAQGPVDLLFLEFAVNDDQDGGYSREECIRGMEGIIRHARRRYPDMDIVMTYFVNEGMLATLQKGETPMRIAAHQAVADHYGLPVIRLAQEVARAISAGELTWQQYGGVHPGPAGNAICARMMGELFERSWEVPLSASALPAAHRMPAALDPYNFESGRFIDHSQAIVKHGWTPGVPDWNRLQGDKRSWYLDKTMLSASEPGAETTLDFEGTAVGAFVIAGPDAGQVESRVDGGPVTVVDIFHPYSRGLHYPRTVMFASALKPGKHTLTLRTSSETSNGGHAMRILKFTAN